LSADPPLAYCATQISYAPRTPAIG